MLTPFVLLKESEKINFKMHICAVMLYLLECTYLDVPLVSYIFCAHMISI